jgi:HUS1 checkpoint protein
MSDVLAIRANNSGCLKLSINTEGVKVDTEWKDCTNPKSMSVVFPSDPIVLYISTAQDNADNGDAEDTPDPEQLFTVLVSVRSFLKFLNCHVVSTTTIACSIHYPLFQSSTI